MHTNIYEKPHITNFSDYLASTVCAQMPFTLIDFFLALLFLNLNTDYNKGGEATQKQINERKQFC